MWQPRGVRVLLVRPASPNERFGLGPFFRVEPLGLEYLATALRDAGHHVAVADLRFGKSLARLLTRWRPGLVGIACTHTVDVPAALAVATEIKQRAGRVFVLVGGHAAGASPDPLLQSAVDAVSLGDGEQPAVELAMCLERGGDPSRVAGLLLRRDRGGAEAFRPTAVLERGPLDAVPLPARDLVAPFQKHYLCVNRMPVWAVETARGCPYRCSFCSIWRHNARTHRLRGIDWVCRDLAASGKNVFIVDDLFWHPPDRSRELARELKRRGIRKEWMLVQARLDTVARNEALLAEWRTLADRFDIFFGFESPRDEHLQQLAKDQAVGATAEGVGVARSLGYGVTGNFLVDPDWGEGDFEAMWALVDRLNLRRAGYTVLTPLPGTPLYDELLPRIIERDWSRYDMSHLLVEPRLGRRRFFELFVESWRRNVLRPASSRKRLFEWTAGLSPGQVLMLLRVLLQTRRVLDVSAYLRETPPTQTPAGFGSE